MGQNVSRRSAAAQLVYNSLAQRPVAHASGIQVPEVPTQPGLEILHIGLLWAIC